MALIHTQLEKLLLALEVQLQELALWQADMPSAQDLNSTQPFSCDTLTFAQWLQFIFIAKISELNRAEASLPATISICPMAEESFKHLGKQAAMLINVIADIDELLSGKRVQTLYV
ncbi:YqcC family protein [Colwelliaceae bacterium BS250]